MEFRLTLDESFLAVQAFFNSIPKRRFIDIMDNISRRQPHGFDDCLIEFPEHVDDEDTPFVGVRFSLPAEEIVVTNADFLSYVETACQAHLREHPDDNARVIEILNRIRQNFPA